MRVESNMFLLVEDEIGRLSVRKGATYEFI